MYDIVVTITNIVNQKRLSITLKKAKDERALVCLLTNYKH